MPATRINKKIASTPAQPAKRKWTGSRKKGTLNKATRIKRELTQVLFTDLVAAAQAGVVCTPLQFFMEVLVNPRSSFKRKAWAATQAAPYLHRKMPIAIDGGEGKPIVIATAKQLQLMDPAQLAQLNDIINSLAGGVTVEGQVMSKIMEDLGQGA